MQTFRLYGVLQRELCAYQTPLLTSTDDHYAIGLEAVGVVAECKHLLRIVPSTSIVLVRGNIMYAVGKLLPTDITTH